MNEPSLLSKYNDAGRRVAALERELSAARGENISLRQRVAVLEASLDVARRAL